MQDLNSGKLRRGSSNKQRGHSKNSFSFFKPSCEVSLLSTLTLRKELDSELEDEGPAAGKRPESLLLCGWVYKNKVLVRHFILQLNAENPEWLGPRRFRIFGHFNQKYSMYKHKKLKNEK